MKRLRSHGAFHVGNMTGIVAALQNLNLVQMLPWNRFGGNPYEVVVEYNTIN